MAKFGEGDPRWIVADRTDGQNVNSWHWEERDLAKQAHEEIKKAMAGYPLCTDESGLTLAVDEVSEISGDVTVAQRKGKMMCYFDLKLTLKWSGTVAGLEDKPSGRCTIAEVDHDTLDTEYPVEVSSTDNNAACQRAEEWMRTTGRGIVRSCIKKYFEVLYEYYQIGKTVKQGALPPSQDSSAGAGSAPKKAEASASTAAAGAQTSISWRMRWRVPQEELFNVLVDERRAAAYTRGPAKIDPRAGGLFEFLGGSISGYYVEVKAPELIKMQWRLKSWEAGIHSSVVMQLTKEEPGVTLVSFAQSGIPAGEAESVGDGWKTNFFNGIKAVFGYTMEYL